MADLPNNLSYGQVGGRFILAQADSSDTGREPDAAIPTGKVKLTPAVGHVINAAASPSPVFIIPKVIELTIDEEGYLVDSQLERDVWVIAGADPDLNPTGWGYKVTFEIPGVTIPSYTLVVQPNTRHDLALVTPLPSAPGTTVVVSESTRIAAEAAALAAQEAAATIIDLNPILTLNGIGPDENGNLQFAGGGEGGTGVDGREVQLQKGTTHIQWRYAGVATWTNLIAISEITGPQGPQGIQGPKGDPGSPATNLVTSVQGKTGAVTLDAADFTVPGAAVLGKTSSGTGTAGWAAASASSQSIGTIITRSTNGQILVTAAPTANSHLANKGYVDEQIAAVELLPGPAGEQGPVGPAGPQGPAGADGSSTAQTVGVVLGGDSQASNDTLYGGTKRLGQLLSEKLKGAVVHEIGYGGADAVAVAGMMGALPTTVNVPGNSLPASGSVTINASNIANPRAIQYEFGANYGWLGGRYGHWEGGPGPTGDKQFILEGTGSVTAVRRDTPWVPERAQGHNGFAAIVWAGHNDINHGVPTATTLDAIDKIVQRYGVERTIVIMPIVGPLQPLDRVDAIKAGITAKNYPLTLNAQQFLMNYGLEYAGLAPTTDDTADIAAGRPPRSLFHTDQVHLNEAGRTALAIALSDMIASRGLADLGDDDVVLPPADTEDPTTPTAVSSSNVTHNSATINWTASTDNSGGTLVYRVRANDGTPTSYQSGTSRTITGLSASSPYQVDVQAKDAAGNESLWSTKHSFSTTAVPADSTRPSSPGQPVASNVTQTSATITWPAATDNVGVTGYRVTGGPTELTPTGTSVNLTGLTAGQQYTISVYARDAAGNESLTPSTVQFNAASAGGGGGTVPFTPAYHFDVSQALVGGEAVNLGSVANARLAPLNSSNMSYAASDPFTVQQIGGVSALKSSVQQRDVGLVGSPGGAIANVAGLLTVAYVVVPTEVGGTFVKGLHLTESPDGGNPGMWDGYFGWDQTKTSHRGNVSGTERLGPPLTVNVPVLLVTTFDPTTREIRSSINGVPMTASPPPTWSTVDLLRHLRIWRSNGTIELIVDTRAWSVQEQADMEAYLKTKHGIA